MTTKPQLERYAALLLCMLALLLAFGRSYFVEDGYFSRDTSNYLRLSENILLGNGLQVPNDGSQPAGLTHFAIWPVGYPLMIASVAATLKVSTYLAARLVNALLLLISMLVIGSTFGRKGLLLCPLLALGGTADIFANTWSEAPFICFLISFSAVLGRALTAEEGRGIKAAFLLLSLGILLFASRYIGAFAAGILVLAAAYKCYCRKMQQGVWLALAATAMSAFMFLYLAYNASQTGFATGMSRTVAPESSVELLGQWMIAFVAQFFLPMQTWLPGSWKEYCIFFLELLLAAYAFLPLSKLTKPQVTREQLGRAAVFILVGVAYLAAVTILRWRSFFEPFSSRLMNPGVVLILLGSFSLLLEYECKWRSRVCLFILAMAATSTAIQIYGLGIGKGAPFFQQTVKARIERYREIPQGAIVVFGDYFLNYLRPDVHVAYPRYYPGFPQAETWENFLGRLDSSKRIFVQVSDEVRIEEGFDASVVNYYQAHHKPGFFEISRP